MISFDQCRNNAEDCLRLAQTDEKESGKTLWVTLAQSWLQLAEDAQRISSEFAAIVPPQEPPAEAGNDPSMPN